MKTKERLLRLYAVCAVGICLTGCGASGKAEEPAVASNQEKTGEAEKAAQTDAAAENEGTSVWKYTLQCTDAVQGTALTDAEVCIFDEKGRETAKGKTDGQGMVTMELAEGSYQVEVKKDGYYVEQSDVSVGAGDQTDRIRLVSSFEGDRYLVLLEWEGDTDLDLLMYDADKDHYIGQGNPTDNNGSFLYADNDATQGYELFSVAKADGIRTFYVKDRQGVMDASSQMETEGVTAKIYAPGGLVQTIQANNEEDAALWIPFYLYQGEVQAQNEYVHDLNVHRKALYDQEALKAYQAFLDGEVSAVAQSGGQQYSMLDLMRKIENGDFPCQNERYGYEDGYTIHDISYAYIDVGNNHIPELQVYFHGNELYEGYFILGYQNTVLWMIDSGSTEGISYFDINYYGIVLNRHSSAGGGGDDEVFALGADGQHKELYRCISEPSRWITGEDDFTPITWIIDGKNYQTYETYDSGEVRSADKKKCLQFFEEFYGLTNIEATTQEKIDALIEQKAEKEGVLDVWIAEKSGDTPELEWHEWQLPTGQQDGQSVLVEIEKAEIVTGITTKGDVPQWKVDSLEILRKCMIGEIHIATGNADSASYLYGFPESFHFGFTDVNNDGVQELLLSYDSSIQIYFPPSYDCIMNVIGYDSVNGTYLVSEGSVCVIEDLYVYDGTSVSLLSSIEGYWDGWDDSDDGGPFTLTENGVTREISKEEFDSISDDWNSRHTDLGTNTHLDIENIENTFHVKIDIQNSGNWLITDAE